MLKINKKKEAAVAESGRAANTAAAQGISAKGNALYMIGTLALIASLVPLVLGFSYLLLLREPKLQEEQITDLSASFALQQAINVQGFFGRLETRVQSAARSPLALSAIASRSSEDLGIVEQAMLDYFPEVISLRIVPIGDMGTANFSGGNKGLRNHIEVDMVRRASEGHDPLPESYKFEDGWLTSFAALVEHPRINDRKAVIIATLDNKEVAKQLASLNSGVGKYTLEQTFFTNGGSSRSDVVASKGQAADSYFKQYAEIPDTNWKVGFTPSQSLLTELNISQVPMYLVLGVIAIAILVAIGIFLVLYPRALSSEVNRIISEADRKSSLELSIPELVTVAKQLRRATLRALRQSSGGSGSGALPVPEVEDITSTGSGTDLTNPMFQSQSLLDEDSDPVVEESLDLDLGGQDDGGLTTSLGAAHGGVPGTIFRAYDIRGNADSELTDEVVMNIGRAVGTIAEDMGEQTLIVGCDGRASSPRIKAALIRALMESGRDVVDIGLVPTPLLYFATRHLSYRSGIMITGSHNPAEDNGLKIVLDQQTIAAGGIQDVRNRMNSGQFSSGNGRMVREDIVSAYIDEVLQDLAIAVPLKIVIDAGNGATSEIAPQLFEELGCEVVPLYCEIDGRFPNHSPDTSNEENLSDLVRAVQDQQADFGVAFDGDGDRLAVVTSSGQIVRSDVLLMLYAQDVVSRNPGADVVFDVKCSRHLTDLITRHGGRPVLWKTGHAFMKEKMRETGALLGGEFSGHMFFGERWFGFDDGMYAAGRLAEILSTHGNSLDDSIAELPSAVNTPEIIIPVPDNYKFKLIDQIVSNADFSAGKINTMDGIRVDFSNGWGLVRASNTVAALTARFEADSVESLEAIKEEFRAQIALVDPDIQLNF